MNELWILFIVLYGLIKGGREGMKKAALKKSSTNEILFFYTLIGFLLIIPFSKTAFSLPPLYIFYAFLKAAVCCAAWAFSLIALRRMSVSLYGIMDMSRMLFATMLGVFVLGEQVTIAKAAGVLLVVLGLFLVNLKKSADNKGITLPILIVALLSCFFNAVSGIMDKVLMQSMDAGQLQFWFMLFMTLIYGAIILLKKEKISLKSVKTNYWIPLMSLSLVFGDRLLFIANGSPLSEVTLMTVIKQSSVIVTVLVGWLCFHEKHILYKLMCTLLVLAGIFIALFL